MNRILVNKIKCNNCGDVIESKNIHDFKWCSCKSVAIDGGRSYLKRCAKSQDDFEDLSEIDNSAIDCETCIYYMPTFSTLGGLCELREVPCIEVGNKKECYVES